MTFYNTFKDVNLSPAYSIRGDVYLLKTKTIE